MAAGPLPARAILSRCQAADEMPSWAKYIRSRPLAPASEETSTHPYLPRPLQYNVKTPAQQVNPVHPYLSASQKPCVARPEAPKSICSSVSGRVWALAQEGQSSRDLQDLLETASSAERENLRRELGGHVLEASKCRHANFVVQKFITPGAPASSAFARELIAQGADAIVHLAKHRFGCRILQRLIEFCDRHEAEELSEFMLRDAEALCANPYGNYTMQHILKHGTQHHRQRLVKLLQEKAVTMGPNFHASAVVGEALRQASPEDGTELARALHCVPGLLSQMARTKHGHQAAKLARQMLGCGANQADEVAEPGCGANQAVERTSLWSELVHTDDEDDYY